MVAVERKDVRMQIAEHLKSKGIKRSWLANQIGKSKALITFILDGEADLTDENLKNINEALGTNFKRA